MCQLKTHTLPSWCEAHTSKHDLGDFSIEIQRQLLGSQILLTCGNLRFFKTINDSYAHFLTQVPDLIRCATSEAGFTATEFLSAGTFVFVMIFLIDRCERQFQKPFCFISTSATINHYIVNYIFLRCLLWSKKITVLEELKLITKLSLGTKLHGQRKGRLGSLHLHVCLSFVWIHRWSIICIPMYSLHARMSLCHDAHLYFLPACIVGNLANMHAWMHIFNCTGLWLISVPARSVRAEQIKECSLVLKVNFGHLVYTVEVLQPQPKMTMIADLFTLCVGFK